MRCSRIRERWSSGRPALVTTLHYMDASLYEMVSLMGFDGIWLDLEHRATSVATAAEMMRASRVGDADVLARVAKGEFMRMQRLLEAGAAGLIYPQCDDATEAAEFAKWGRFPPLGRRGCDAGGADAPFTMSPIPGYLEHANRETMLIILIENPDAVDRVDEIVDVEGVDLLLLGPGDLSIAYGVPGEPEHPKVIEATKRIAAAAERAGKYWGMPVGSRDGAARAIDQGARLVCHQSDQGLLKAGLERILSDFAPLGFEFD